MELHNVGFAQNWLCTKLALHKTGCVVFTWEHIHGLQPATHSITCCARPCAGADFSCAAASSSCGQKGAQAVATAFEYTTAKSMN